MMLSPRPTSSSWVCPVLSWSLFTDPACGNVLRVKGFVEDDGRWYELNAAAAGLTAAPIPQGQQVLIVIGEGLDKARLEEDLRR